jgi:spore maturation protein CgeB
LNFDYPYYMSDRIFETTGRAGFIIHPYVKGIEDLFEIDKEIVTYEFENFAELRRKIDYYLVHDDEREAIRKAGHERTKRDHTYLKRWETILATVGSG